MPGRSKSAEDFKQKSLKSFFFPYTILEKAEGEAEVGDTIVLQAPERSFFARYTSNSLSQSRSATPQPNASRSQSPSQKASPIKLRETSTKDVTLETPDKDYGRENRRASSKTATSPWEEACGRDNAPSSQTHTPQPEDKAIVMETLNDALNIDQKLTNSRNSPQTSSSQKRRRSSAKSTSDVDENKTTTPKAKRKSLSRSRVVSFNETPIQHPAKVSSRTSKEPEQVATEDEKAGRRSRSSSVLSIASHTPSVSISNTRPYRNAPTALGSSFIIRSSQEDENEEEDKEFAAIEAAYDSDSSLEDLDVVVAKTSSPAKPAPRPPNNLSSSGRFTRSQLHSSLASSTSSQRRPLFSPAALAPTYKFSMSNLIKQQTRDITAQAEVAAANAVFATPSTDRTPQDAGTDLHTDSYNGITSSDYQHLLSTVVKQEVGENQVEKMMQAMNRTDSLRSETDWYAFDHANAPAGSKPTVCPSAALSGEAKHIFQDEDVRRCAFLAGEVPEQALTWNLSDEVLSWIFERALSERSNSLSVAYIDALKSFGPDRIGNLIQPEQLYSVFRRHGAFPALLDPNIPIERRRYAKQRLGSRIPTNLRQTVNNLGLMSSCLSISCKKTALALLLRLGIDSEICQHAETRFVLQDAISMFADSFLESELHHLVDIQSDFIDILSEEVLQLRVVTAIPDFSSRLRSMKRQMALSFFFSESINSRTWSQDPSQLTSKVVQQLTAHEKYDITNGDVDFIGLSASIVMLDIGIGGGFRQPLFDETLHTVMSREEETDFNDNIDRIAKRVSTISGRIPDSGASHMSRSDAKIALVRLHDRLMKSVRTKPKVKKSIFESPGATNFVSGAEASILSNFLQRKPLNQGLDVMGEA